MRFVARAIFIVTGVAGLIGSALAADMTGMRESSKRELLDMQVLNSAASGSGWSLDIVAWLRTIGLGEIGLRNAFRESLDSF